MLACPPSGLPGDFIPKTELPSVKFVQISNYFYSPRIALDLVLKLYLAKVSYYVSCNFQYQFFFFFQSENLASRTISQSRINSRKFTAERGGGEMEKTTKRQSLPRRRYFPFPQDLSDCTEKGYCGRQQRKSINLVVNMR